MNWLVVSAIASAISAIGGMTGAFVAATALKRNRADAARRDAAGLHASVYFTVQGFPDGYMLPPQDEPSALTDVWLVAKVSNTSPHPYYSVAASVFLTSRQKRFAATTDIIPAMTTRYARLTLTDGCDLAGTGNDTLVETSFIDSNGRGWHRGSDGLLEPRKVRRQKAQPGLSSLPHRGMTLHGIAEDPHATNSEGNGIFVTRDSSGHEVELTWLEPSVEEVEADKMRFPPPVVDPAAGFITSEASSTQDG